MESELLHAKERLAVERRAQQHKPALGDGTGAVWARMRQRVCSAEREARGARRMAVALLGVTLVAVTGVFAVALPWPAAIGSPRDHGDTPARAGLAPDRLLAWTEGDGTLSPPSDRSEQTVVTPGNAGSGIEALRPGIHDGGAGVHEAARPGARTPELPGEVPVVGRVAISGASPAGPPMGAGSRAPGFVASTHEGQARRIPGVADGRPQRMVRAGAEQPRELPLRPSPSPARRPVAAPRPRVRRTGTRARRAGRSSVRRGSRTRWRRRRASRLAGRPVYWRVHRSSRAASGTYCLMDPYGNWWEARRVGHRGVRRAARRR